MAKSIVQGEFWESPASRRSRKHVKHRGNGQVAFVVPEDLHAAVCEEYRNGSTLAELAAKYGCKWWSVRYILEKAGVPFRPRSESRRPSRSLSNEERIAKAECRTRVASHEEREEIRQEYLAGATAYELAQKYGVTMNAIYYYVGEGGKVGRIDRRISKETRAAIVDGCRDGKRVLELAKQLDVDVKTVYHVIKQHKVPVTAKVFRKYALNEQAFSVDGPERNYWLGWMITDGCVYNKTGSKVYHVQLNLAEEDAAQVEAFRRFLGTDQPIQVKPAKSKDGYTHQPQHCLSVASQTLGETLVRFGIVPRKTPIARIIGPEDDRDFWRGAVEGDGSLQILSKNANNRTTVLGLVGAPPLLRQFAAFASKRLGIPAPHVITPKGSPETFAYVRVYGKNAIRMAHVLYDGCTISLPRKHVIAQEFFVIEEKRRLKKEVVRLCSVPGCERRYWSKGLCRTHDTMKRQKDRLGRDDLPRCSVTGCARPYLVKGMCKRHYQNSLYHKNKAASLLP